MEVDGPGRWRDTATGVLSSMARMIEDLPWRGFVVAFVGVHLPFLLPIASAFDLATYADLYVQVLLLPVVLIALRWGTREIEHREELQFWNYLSFAVLCWWIVRWTYVLIPRDQRGAEVHLAIDGVYLLFYIGFLLAAATKPHIRSDGEGRTPLWTVETLSWAGLVFTLLVYFVLIPIDFTPRSYDTWEASLYFYLSLDAIVAIRFAQLAIGCRSFRWRTTYWLLCSTAVQWAVFGVLEILWSQGSAAWLDATWTNILWQLPLLTLVLAVRLWHRSASSNGSVVEKRLRREGLLRNGSSLVAATLVLPTIHFGLSLAGLLDAATRTPREWLVLSGLVMLGGLALFERSLMQKQSLHQNTYLSSLIESSPLPTVLLDPQHRVLTCNPAFEALFIYSCHKIVGLDLDDLITTDATLSEASGVTDRVQSGESTFTVGRRNRSDGSPVDVRIFGIPLRSEGRLIGIYALYQDITERLAAEQTLKDSEERFRRLSEAAFEGVILSDQGKIIDANQQAAEIFGYTVEDMIGKPIGTRVSKDQKALVQERSQSNYELPYELECYRKDRSKFTMEARGKSIPYRGRDARVTVVRDITEQRKLEEKFRRSQKIEAIGRLTAGIAHDFNNLLTVILGRGEVLARRLEAGSEPQQWSEEITGAARRAALMIQQLLAFGRKQPLRVESVDLNAALQAMEKMLKRLLPPSIVLELEPGVDLGSIQADPSQIEQVIMNLVINSRDAMPEGGELTLETARIEISESIDRDVVDIDPGTYACLTVTDSGAGMSAEILEQAFEPFFTTKVKGEGAGLGLATVYGIVKQSGGGISVDSTIGCGTVVRVFLPCSDDPSRESDSSHGLQERS